MSTEFDQSDRRKLRNLAEKVDETPPGLNLPLDGRATTYPSSDAFGVVMPKPKSQPDSSYEQSSYKQVAKQLRVLIHVTSCCD